MAKEKITEKTIQAFIQEQGYWVEGMQSGKILVKKGPYSNYMHLTSKGTPDLIACIKSQFVGIEVKKNEEEYNNWLVMEKRYRGQGKSPPESAHREVAQIEHKDLILENGGLFILTYSLEHFIGLYKELWNQETKKKT